MAAFTADDLVAHETYAVPRFVLDLKPHTPPDVREGMFTGGGKRGPGVGWDVAARINETVDQDGKVHAGVFNRGANQGEADANHWTLAMKSRRRDDRGVIMLREHLRKNNGINGLEMCEPHEVDRAARIFHRDGIVIVKNALNPEQLEVMRAAADEVFAEILSYEGSEGRAYHTESGRLPHRYSFGTSSSSRQMLHHPAWAMLTELDTCCPIIDKIYNNPGEASEWAISGAGGDMALPGAVECQGLHRDAAPPDMGLRIGGKQFERRSAHARSMEMPSYIEPLLKDLRNEETPAAEMSLYTMRALSEMLHPSGTINFLMTDSSWENGPLRTILGSHCNVQQPPKADEEPEWMRLSTLVGAPAGSAIFRDHRVWHSGTPNLSCGYNRPCAHQYVAKYQSCMVETGRFISHASYTAFVSAPMEPSHGTPNSFDSFNTTPSSDDSVRVLLPQLLLLLRCLREINPWCSIMHD